MAKEHISGRDAGEVMLYALSTCIWCRKTKGLLEDLGVAYDYTYVDLLDGDEREQTIEVVRSVNPSLSFPTLLVNSKCIVGFREPEIREALGAMSLG